MARILDLAGQRLGLLTVLYKRGKSKSGDNLWVCQCDCGQQCSPTASSLARGATRSCGCNRTPKKPNARSRQSEYKTWKRIKNRCYNPNCDKYEYYGGRGITVCPRWLDSYDAFLSDMGLCPPGHEIDRIDGSGNYCPENCRWVTKTQQVRNRRSTLVVEADGVTAPLAEHAERIGITYAACFWRWKKFGSVYLPTPRSLE
jgi:hypothetical protein